MSAHHRITFEVDVTDQQAASGEVSSIIDALKQLAERATEIGYVVRLYADENKRTILVGEEAAAADNRFEIGDRVRVPDSRNTNGVPAIEATVTRVIRSADTTLIAYITDDGDARWTYTSRAELVSRPQRSRELDAKLVAAHTELLRLAAGQGLAGEAASATQRRVVDGVHVVATWTRGLDSDTA